MSAGSASYQQFFGLYARYNQWFNDKLLRLLSDQPDFGDGSRQAAAGAILRQLNHVLVMDLVWLHRFKVALDGAGEPVLDTLMAEPHAMGEILFWRFADMTEPRADTDTILIRFVAGLTPARCDMPVSFRTLAEGERVTRPLWALLLHLFNHQSLHRGEIIAHLAALQIDIGPTDILPLIGDVAAAGDAQ